MKLNSIGIILTPTFRAYAYLQYLTRNNLLPNFAILMIGKNKDVLKTIARENKQHFFHEFHDFKISLKNCKIPYVEIEAEDCNDKRIIDVIKKRKEKYFIYSGGGILKEEILTLGRKFIHVHPGIVPNYRGSTCIYYSIINDDNCGVTAIFMSKNVDAGDVIAKKTFNKPRIANIDYEYDSFIRSSLLVDIMKDYGKRKKFDSKPQEYDTGETYFIIHPVLKHLAILSCLAHEKH